MRIGRREILVAFATLLFMTLGSVPARAQFGLALSGVGPINRSMGGAAVAAPIDAAGALFWNPATISGLGRSEMEFATEVLIPRTTVQSRVPAGAFGPNFPPRSLSGNNGGNNGVFPLPAFGLVYQPESSAWTYGIGFFELGGFGVNYPASLRNPIFSPQAPFGRGVGALYTQYLVYQVAPTVSYRVSDQVSIGVAGNVDLGGLSVDPALFSTPGLVLSPLGPGPVYPPATHGRARWGGGFNVGVFYTPETDWQFGASVRSPQWFETYTYNAVSSQGLPITPKFNLDFPMIASVGTAYTGFERLLLATDFRFLDYRDTNGFRHSGFDKTGAFRGLGWQNVFALGTGAQYQWTDTLSLRAGYTFSLNPAGNAVTSFNVGSPTIVQHTLALGASYDVTKALRLSFAYVHDFQNQIHGPLILPFVGPIPGSNVRSASTADAVILGATVIF
ncbi:MAG: outer membrane protein transport protein [Planctomycetaceae bacterium]|nr:outer membrane protein transport protein [Planctomycetaceae bacterium]MBV8609101.1 outer membrane protein transport protein [Singulisphaera sp.]